jgi:hypothetical protein
LAIDVAEMIIERIYNLFPTALSFVDNHQKQLLEQKFAKDFLVRGDPILRKGKSTLSGIFLYRLPVQQFV